MESKEDCDAMTSRTDKSISSDAGVEQPKANSYECSVCYAVFETEYVLKLHRKTRHVHLNCNLCNSFFSSEEDKDLHSTNFGDDSPHLCQVCNKVFKVQCTLIQHSRVHSMEPTMKCEICRRMFTEEGLKAHRPKHAATCSSFRCTICHEMFANDSSLARHSATHENREEQMIKILSCAVKDVPSQAVVQAVMKEGSFMFKNPSSVVHFSVKRIDSSKNRPVDKPCQSSPPAGESSNDVKSYVCMHCNKTLVSQSALDLHCKLIHKTLLNANLEQENATDAKKIECKKCHDNFTTNEDLALHLAHNRKCVVYKCSLCEQFFDNERARQEHRTVRPNIEHRCPVCCKAFKVRCTLTQHSRVHSASFKCERCHASFTKEMFEAHKLSNECFSRCQTCSVRFNSEEDYKKHKETFPNGECVHKCHHCRSSFKSENGLRMHMNSVHKSMVLPLQKCYFCDDKFSDKKSFSEHLVARHMGNLNETRPKKHVCTVCNESYRTKPQLTNHAARKHSGERPFKCDQCGKSYATKSGLYSHNRIGKHHFEATAETQGPSAEEPKGKTQKTEDTSQKSQRKSKKARGKIRKSNPISDKSTKSKRRKYMNKKLKSEVYPVGQPIPAANLQMILKQEQGNLSDEEDGSFFNTEATNSPIGDFMTDAIKTEKPESEDYKSSDLLEDSHIKTEVMDSTYEDYMKAMEDVPDDFKVLDSIKSELDDIDD